MSYPNYLGFLRKKSGLSQAELAELLGTSRSVVSRAELGTREATLDFALGCEVVFGTSPREVFTGLYNEVEERVMSQGALLDATVRHKSDEGSSLKRHLLNAMMERASSRATV